MVLMQLTAATAQIQSLAQELPYAIGVALKKKKSFKNSLSAQIGKEQFMALTIQ